MNRAASRTLPRSELEVAAQSDLTLRSMTLTGVTTPRADARVLADWLRTWWRSQLQGKPACHERADPTQLLGAISHRGRDHAT